MTSTAETTIKVEVLAHDLYRVLYNAALFASPDPGLQVLNAVHIVVDATSVMAEATDRYSIGRDEAPLSEPSEGACDVLLPLERVKSLVVSLRHSKLSASLAVSDTNLSVHYASGSWSYPLLQATGFPDLSSHIQASQKAAVDTSCLSFNPELLARYARLVKPAVKNIKPAITIIPHGTKAAEILVNGMDSFTSVLMPMKARA